MKTVLGVDLSLSSTGLAGRSWTTSIKTGTLDESSGLTEKWARLVEVRSAVMEYLHSDLHLVVLEGPSYGSNLPGANERAYLRWWLIGYCHGLDVPVVEVAPPTLKKYATGNGRADKKAIVKATRIQRPDVPFTGHDEADALNLAAMGLDYLGESPVPPKPHQRAAVDVVRWPVA